MRVPSSTKGEGLSFWEIRRESKRKWPYLRLEGESMLGELLVGLGPGTYMGGGAELYSEAQGCE